MESEIVELARKAEELAAKATPGPWEWSNKSRIDGSEDDYWDCRTPTGARVLDDGSACGEYNQEIDPRGPDAEFIAFARTALPELARAVIEAEERETKYWVDKEDQMARRLKPGWQRDERARIVAAIRKRANALSDVGHSAYNRDACNEIDTADWIERGYPDE